MNFSLVNKLISFLICISFILSGFMKTFIGNYNTIIQLFTIFMTFVISTYYLFNSEQKNIFYLLLLALFLLIIVPFFSDIGYLNTISSISFSYNVLLGYILFKNKNFAVKILYTFLLFNLLFLIIETFWGFRIVIPSEGYENDSYFIVYTYGLFSSPKNGGFFILIVGLLAYMQRKTFFLLIAFLSSLFSGVRISTIVLLLPLILLGINYLKQKSVIISSCVMLLVVAVSYLIVNHFFLENEYVLNRFFSILDIENDQSNLSRFYYWNAHFSFYKEYPIENILWGNYQKAPMIIGNGAENAFLDLLTNGGLFAFLLYFLPLIYLMFHYFFNNKFFFIFPLILLALFTGRFAMGFSDGSVLWMIFFVFLSREGNSFFSLLQESKNYNIIKIFPNKQIFKL